MNRDEELLKMIALIGNSTQPMQNNTRPDDPFASLNNILTSRQNESANKSNALLGLQQMLFKNKIDEENNKRAFDQQKEMFNMQSQAQIDAENRRRANEIEDRNALYEQEMLNKTAMFTPDVNTSPSEFETTDLVDSKKNEFKNVMYDKIQALNNSLAKKEINIQDFNRRLEALRNEEKQYKSNLINEKSFDRAIDEAKSRKLPEARETEFEFLSPIDSTIDIVKESLRKDNSVEKRNEAIIKNNVYFEPFTENNNLFSSIKDYLPTRSLTAQNLLRNNVEFTELLNRSGIDYMKNKSGVERMSDLYQKAVNEKINFAKSLIGDVGYVPSNSFTLNNQNNEIKSYINNVFGGVDNDIDIYQNRKGNVRYYVAKGFPSYIMYNVDTGIIKEVPIIGDKIDDKQ